MKGRKSQKARRMRKAKAAKSRQTPHKPAKSRKSQTATCRRGTGNAEDATSQKATKSRISQQKAEKPRSREAAKKSQEAKKPKAGGGGGGKKREKKHPKINTPPLSFDGGSAMAQCPNWFCGNWGPKAGVLLERTLSDGRLTQLGMLGPGFSCLEWVARPREHAAPLDSDRLFCSKEFRHFVTELPTLVP